MLVAKTLEYPLRRVALLAVNRSVLFQNTVNDIPEGVQLRALRWAGGGGSQAAPSARASSSPSLALCQTDSPPLADSAHQHGTPAERVDKGPRYTSSHLPSRKGSKATGGRVLLRPQPGKSRRFRGLICHRRTHAGAGTESIRMRPPMLSTNRGCSAITGRLISSGDLADWLEDQRHGPVQGAPYHPQTQLQDRGWHQTLKNRVLLENYYLPGDLEMPDRRLRRSLQQPPLPREPRQRHAGRVYFGRHTAIIERRKMIETDHTETPLEPPTPSRLTSNQDEPDPAL